jgi:hypothetical protein
LDAPELALPAHPIRIGAESNAEHKTCQMLCPDLANPRTFPRAAIASRDSAIQKKKEKPSIYSNTKTRVSCKKVRQQGRVDERIRGRAHLRPSQLLSKARSGFGLTSADTPNNVDLGGSAYPRDSEEPPA